MQELYWLDLRGYYHLEPLLIGLDRILLLCLSFLPTVINYYSLPILSALCLGLPRNNYVFTTNSFQSYDINKVSASINIEFPSHRFDPFQLIAKYSTLEQIQYSYVES